MRISLTEPASWQTAARRWIIRSPYWWAWLSSVAAWVFLLCMVPSESPGEPILCTAQGSVSLSQTSLSPPTIGGWGLTHYTIMILAMMFPLLSNPIAHVGFSVQRKIRDIAIAFFLAGYTAVWVVIGLVFSVLASYLRLKLATYPSAEFLSALGFLIGALIFWLPSRRLSLMACERTLPIRMCSFGSFVDCFGYGAYSGLTCAKICWAPMLIMFMNSHSFSIMAFVTISIFLERYYLHNESRIIGNVWVVTALVFIFLPFLPRVLA